MFLLLFAGIAVAQPDSLTTDLNETSALPKDSLAVTQARTSTIDLTTDETMYPDSVGIDQTETVTLPYDSLTPGLSGTMLMAADSLKLPSPASVMYRSAILPGWGQWVNGKKFKSLLVAGGEIGLLANAAFLNQKAIAATSEDEKLFYEDNRSLNIWIALGLYFLNLMDAYVDAHLADFDIGPNLTQRTFQSSDQACLTLIAWEYRF